MNRRIASDPREVRKRLVGQHLLRVRIRDSVFERLKEVAEELTEHTGAIVSVSDLARSAIYNYLLIYNKLEDLSAGPEGFDEDELDLEDFEFPDMETDEPEDDDEPSVVIVLGPLLN